MLGYKVTKTTLNILHNYFLADILPQQPLMILRCGTKTSHGDSNGI